MTHLLDPNCHHFEALDAFHHRNFALALVVTFLGTAVQVWKALRLIELEEDGVT